MVVNVLVVRAMVFTQSEDRSIIYFATVLANEMYTLQEPTIGFNAMVVYAIIVTLEPQISQTLLATVIACSLYARHQKHESYRTNDNRIYKTSHKRKALEITLQLQKLKINSSKMFLITLI